MLTTSFADDPGPADVPDGFGRGAHFEPLTSLPRDEAGAYVLRPGFFTFEAMNIELKLEPLIARPR